MFMLRQWGMLGRRLPRSADVSWRGSDDAAANHCVTFSLTGMGLLMLLMFLCALTSLSALCAPASCARAYCDWVWIRCGGSFSTSLSCMSQFVQSPPSSSSSLFNSQKHTNTVTLNNALNYRTNQLVTSDCRVTDYQTNRLSG